MDGTGDPARPADVGVRGDRIAAVGDLSMVDDRGVARVLDAGGRVVCPGFVDPHGHSDGSVLVDGALASHLHQGFTTQLSGNCGESVAPITPVGREVVDLTLRPVGVEPSWRTFAEYLEAVERRPLGPNVAFLVGHGTIRAAVLGPDPRPPAAPELRTMIRELEAALDTGAFGLSSGLIYAPGIHAAPAELERLAAVVARRGALYATHMRNEGEGLFDSLRETLAAARAVGEGSRVQVSHLKAGARAVWGRAREAVAVLERARDRGLAIGADQYPYAAAGTTLATILPPALLALPVDHVVGALSDPEIRDRIRAEIGRGIAGWENPAADPGWEGIRIAAAPSHPDWAGRSIALIARELDADPLDVALDALADDRLDVSCVQECMVEADVEAILQVPWIAVCTDAAGRRPGHPTLDAGVPHPRAYGTAPRVLGRYVRERGVLPLEAGIAKLTSVPAAQIGLADRGVIREGAFADLVVFDPFAVADVATFDRPARYPDGIRDVIVNGVPAILSGTETGERSGRLLRYG